VHGILSKKMIITVSLCAKPGSPGIANILEQ